MSKELEYIQRQINIVKQQVKGSKVKIIVTDTVTKYRYDYYERELQTLENIEQALDRLEAIDNSNPSEATKLLEHIICSNNLEWMPEMIRDSVKRDLETIKQALLKAQVQEKEKLLFKNIHNTKVKTPLVSIFEGLSKDERFKFTEHIYYHWEEMKEELEDKISSLQKELEQALIQKSKKEQAWNIVVKKNVDMLLIKKYDNVSDYNSAVWLSGREKLTEEEFKTLKKEILK